MLVLSRKKNEIIKLQGEQRMVERQIDEMTTFLAEHGQVPRTMEEWAKEVNH